MTEDEPPPNPTKLTRSKQRWAEEGRFLTGRTARPESERLPPGQHLVKDWPVLDLGMQPDVEKEDWKLKIFGAVENPLTWDWAGFTGQKQSRFVSDIHCVTTWSRYDNRWDGVATRDLLETVKPRPGADFVLLHSSDGYTTNLTLDDFAAEDALLAHSWEGKPLSLHHGGPVRLVVPHLYFWKSAKWISKVEFRTDNHPGYWEVRGYHDRGDPWREERYSND
ncbi:MAG: molybdopterin-binding protein [Rhodospirillales bacterium]|nr:molybdopterin-binding protein [Rhodospirillales bacterium]